MKDLIEALTIMLKHGDVHYPTHCSHDELFVYPASMDFTEDELKRLDELGFMVDEDMGDFHLFALAVANAPQISQPLPHLPLELA